MTLLPEVLETLRDPARWHRYSLYGRTNSACLLGTLRKQDLGYTYPIQHDVVSRDYWKDKPEVLALAKVIEEQFPERVPPAYYAISGIVSHFNDHPSTTHDDIILVLEKAVANEQH